MDLKKLQDFVIENYSAILIGNLIHGIIHNLNGSLQTLTMQCDLNKMDYERYIKSCEQLNDDFRDKYLKKIDNFDRELYKIRDILNNISQKRVDSTKRPVILNEIILNAIKFWTSDLFFKHQIKTNLTLPERDVYIVTDPTRFSELIDAVMLLNIESLKKAREKGNNELFMDIKLLMENEVQKKINLSFTNNCQDIETEKFPESINLISISCLIIEKIQESLSVKVDISKNSVILSL